MPLSRGSVVVSDAGVASPKTGLTGRLYDVLLAKQNADIDGGVPTGVAGVPILQNIASLGTVLAEWLTPPVVDKGSVSGDVTINLLDGLAQKFTLSGNVNLVFTNIPDTGTVVVHVKQSAAGGNTVTWNQSKLSGVDGIVSVLANARDIYVGQCEGGSIWWSTPTRNLV